MNENRGRPSINTETASEPTSRAAAKHIGPETMIDAASLNGETSAKACDPFDPERLRIGALADIGVEKRG